MACYDLLFEAFLQEENVQLMKRKCHELRDHLHARKDDMKEVFEEVSSILLKLFDATLEQELSEMAHFLRSYVKQVESLLHLIRASRQGEWKLHLGALEENVTTAPTVYFLQCFVISRQCFVPHACNVIAVFSTIFCYVTHSILLLYFPPRFMSRCNFEL